MRRRSGAAQAVCKAQVRRYVGRWSGDVLGAGRAKC